MIKFVQYGCGKMSLYTMRYAIEKGYELVGAVDINPNLIGKDISVVLGGNDKGIKITDASLAEDLLKLVKPDIVIITTMSLLNDIKDSLLLCSKLGINAITTCEEAFFPFNSNPVLTSKIDKLAKENNCTITGSGYQDAYWGNLISTLVGSCASIREIRGSSSYNVEDYGIALAKAHGAGLSVDEFDRVVASGDNISDFDRNKLIESGNFLPSYMWNTSGWLCDKLNLHILNQSQKCVPQFSDCDIDSKTLGMVIKKGTATGMSAVVTTDTLEGITITAECIGKVYSSNDFDCNNWSIIGEPDINMVINRPATVELTCATIVNRIEDVINSEPGFVPTSRMGELKNRL